MYDEIKIKFNRLVMETSASHLKISLAKQRLDVTDASGQSISNYSISTAKNGAGERINSECTPLGWHVIDQKIGAGVTVGSVFVGRELTGEIYSKTLAQQYPNRDWILTRILWLSGLEPGVNQGGEVDTFSRYIYLHGTPDQSIMGLPGSHGCVRMHNEDIVDLFDRVHKGDKVLITEE